MTTYNVTARPWDGGWELHIDGVGVTQIANLAGAVQQVRDYVETDLEIDASDAEVHVTFDIPGDLARRADDAKRAATEAAEAQTRAAAMARSVVADMKSAGLRQSDIAAVLGVSKGRVSQLVH